MQVFADNPFPQRMYKAGIENINGRYVNRKEDIQAALADGWSHQPIHSEWPKWVGPHNEEVSVTVPDGKGGFYQEIHYESRGGKVCQNAKEEAEHLEVLAAQTVEGAESELTGEKRGPGRPRKAA